MLTAQKNFIAEQVCVSRRACLIAFIFVFIGVSLSFCVAETKNPKNFGFVPSTIWYSKDPFFAGEKIRIYSAIFNYSEYDISGTVEFYDNGKLIGKSDFAIAGGGRLRDVWTDWVAAKGNHKTSAKIVNGKISTAGGKDEAVALENSQTREDERFVDSDTDGAKIGDISDEDDDNDGVSDAEEVQRGTDPLKKDTPTPSIQAIQKDGNIQNDTSEDVPSELLTTAGSVVQNINTFVDKQKEKLETKKEEVKKEIAKINSAEAENPEKGGKIEKENEKTAIEKTFRYIFLASLSAVSLILEYKILFYFILSIILYKTLKYIFRRIFKSRES